MLEYSEVINLSQQLQSAVVGKIVKDVLPPTKPHRFCWFSGDPKDYAVQLKGQRVSGAEGFGIFVEMHFTDHLNLCFNDGVNVRLIDEKTKTKDYQMIIEFTDGSGLLFTVAMYGGIILHRGDYENEYYQLSRQAYSPFAPGFESHFGNLLKNLPKLSAKAFLATEQRFPGIGNGTVQDILFCSRIHPKRKIGTLNQEEEGALLTSVRSVLKEATEKGGRDTEKDLYGKSGGYHSLMSKNSLGRDCPHCGQSIVKEQYLGGAIYYCPACQPLKD